MNGREEAQKREAKKQEDALRCPGCNHPQGFCTCPKAGGGDGGTGKSGTKEEKSEKSAQHTTKLSDSTSFLIESGSTADTKKIIFIYDDPAKKHGANIMLVTFPENPLPGSPEAVEVPMNYDEMNKRYSVSIERANDVGEGFLITTAKIPGKEENKNEPVLQQGFVSLKDGKQQPVNKLPGVPEGKLETLLLTKEGKIQRPSTIDEKTLNEGERFIKVYTPPGYDPNREPPYNFQITLDGGQYLFPMQMNVVFDNLIAAKQMEPVVAVFISPHSGHPVDGVEGFGIVMPKGYPLSMRLKEYNCNYEFADMLKEVPNSLRGQFNVTDDPKHTTIWGVSAGGLQAIYTALLHPKVFGNVVAESPQAWNIPEQHGKGKDWRNGIVEKFDERGNCTWENGTALLPPIEGPHNEHITQIMRTGQDPISGRTLDSSKPIVFYFDAGEREKEYHPKEGTANLVKATELFAAAAIDKGHKVIDNAVHVLPNGGHHNMTWMRNLADAARSIHSPTSALTLNALASKSSEVELRTPPTSGEVKDEAHAVSNSPTSRTVLISAPGSPRASQNMLGNNRMDSDPNKDGDTQSKSSLPNPFATPTLKPHD